MPLIFSDAKVQKKSHTFYDVGLILRDLFEITILPLSTCRLRLTICHFHDLSIQRSRNFAYRGHCQIMSAR